MIKADLLQERAIADLEHLPPNRAAHFAGQVQAGIGLVNGLALRAGEVDKMAAVLKHLGNFFRYILYRQKKEKL